MIILITLAIMLVCVIVFIGCILLSPPPRDMWEQEQEEELKDRHKL